MTEHDYRAILDGLQEDVDRGGRFGDEDEQTGLLGVFQVKHFKKAFLFSGWIPPG